MKGYIALTTVLIVVPLLLLTGINTLYQNITYLSVSKMDYDYQLLKITSESCLEETVYYIKRNPLFVGDYVVSIGDAQCDINIQNKVGYPGIKTLYLDAQDNTGSKVTFTKELNTNSNPFEIVNIE